MYVQFTAPVAALNDRIVVESVPMPCWFRMADGIPNHQRDPVPLRGLPRDRQLTGRSLTTTRMLDVALTWSAIGLNNKPQLRANDDMRLSGSNGAA